MNAGIIEGATLIHNPVSGDDGGLKRRQILHEVKERMDAKDFRRNRDRVLHCGEKHSRSGTDCGRPFRSWSGLRSHLIGYHRIDHREVPGVRRVRLLAFSWSIGLLLSAMYANG